MQGDVAESGFSLHRAPSVEAPIEPELTRKAVGAASLPHVWTPSGSLAPVLVTSRARTARCRPYCWGRTIPRTSRLPRPSAPVLRTAPGRDCPAAFSVPCHSRLSPTDRIIRRGLRDYRRDGGIQGNADYRNAEVGARYIIH